MTQKTSPKRLESNKRYAETHPDIIRAIKRKYYYNHREQEIARNTQHRKEKWLMSVTPKLEELHFTYRNGVFCCLDCDKIYLQFGVYLTKHREEHTNSKGGEKKMLQNSWTYEEVEEALLASFNGKTPSEVSTLMEQTRTSGAIASLLNQFYTWHTTEGKINYVSQVLRNHFTRYVKEHADEIPTRPTISTEEATQEEEETQEQKTETVQKPVDAESSFASLKGWFEAGGPLIMKHIEAEVTRKVEEAKVEMGKKFEKQEEELNELREYKKKVQSLLA